MKDKKNMLEYGQEETISWFTEFTYLTQCPPETPNHWKTSKENNSFQFRHYINFSRETLKGCHHLLLQGVGMSPRDPLLLWTQTPSAD